MSALDSLTGAVDIALDRPWPARALREIGRVSAVSQGVVTVDGLSHLGQDELIRFEGGGLAVASSLTEARTGAMLLFSGRNLAIGMNAFAEGRRADIQVGSRLLGRVINPLGEPLDGGGPLGSTTRRPLERPAPAIMARAPVRRPLATGLKAVDAAVPIGRGQRELILGDRQTGKTSLAIDAILNQGEDVISVYCAIGQRQSAVAKAISALHAGNAARTIVVVASGEDPPGLRLLAPFAAMSIAEFIMERGGDALVVFDDLTRHARAYRELSLLLRRPPGREAYPGDIFYLHARLLERATQLSSSNGGGSITALPIAETQGQNLAAYIPTNLISITDGQIFLSPDLFEKGVLPAIDLGRSVSRVGGKAQPAGYRAVAGDMKLHYAQFEELEAFARFGTRLDDDTRERLERGRRVREILKQDERAPMTPMEQIAVIMAATNGALDGLSPNDVSAAESAIRNMLSSEPGPSWSAFDPSTPPDASALRALIEELKTVTERDFDKLGEATSGDD